MAILEQLTNEILKKHRSERLVRLMPIKLFYLFHGRNAWWGIWVKQYRDDCMHLNLQDAKGAAERQRVQGSVFQIEELPALLFVFQSIVLVITEINVRDPLSGYSRSAMRKHPSDGKKMTVNASDDYLVPDAIFEGVSLSFQHDSRFWLQPPPPKNHVLQLVTGIPVSRVERLDDDVYGSCKYRSVSSQPVLTWGKGLSDVKKDSVKVLAADALNEAERLRDYFVEINAWR